jgi:hypothetical protein
MPRISCKWMKYDQHKYLGTHEASQEIGDMGHTQGP